MRSFIGHFDVWPGADVLNADDFTRMSRIYSHGRANFDNYGYYAY